MEENIGENISDTGLDKEFLNMIPKHVPKRKKKKYIYIYIHSINIKKTLALQMTKNKKIKTQT